MYKQIRIKNKMRNEDDSKALEQPKNNTENASKQDRYSSIFFVF